MEKQKTPTMQPTSEEFHKAAFKLLANPHIKPTVEFITALTKPRKYQEDRKFFRFCVANYPGCFSVKLMRVCASKEPRVSYEIRESAMRFLHGIFITEEASMDFEVVQVFSSLLISCLEEQVISETSFKTLCLLVKRVAFEKFTIQETTWHGLLEFILSRAEPEFAKAVFVFKSLSMPLDEEEFLIPLMENLLPAILKRLGDNEEESSSQWGLAFVGGFCAAVHLLETTRVALVENLASMMLKSVNRRMELGFLLKALRDLEIAIVEQLWWYCTTEFKFVLGLIQRIDAIITEQTAKNVLQRIKMVVKKKMLEYVGEIDNGDEDWLNQRH
ncbi:Armadillo-type fold [Arabidopsis thaliana x Arabidopsis arenosa]|uniref:Armadillo-type fold n=1 Tax=Arabidopsis thaliana x Arabidopsis arenosa TaxID=1240361 RepID=A0A8T2BF90_9BRAS|nr:Armadillo-type fold [Arabidopsis thaliana x Arabidopsis arenosa]